MAAQREGVKGRKMFTSPSYQHTRSQYHTACRRGVAAYPTSCRTARRREVEGYAYRLPQYRTAGKEEIWQELGRYGQSSGRGGRREGGGKEGGREREKGEEGEGGRGKEKREKEREGGRGRASERASEREEERPQARTPCAGERGVEGYGDRAAVRYGSRAVLYLGEAVVGGSEL
eukprot:3737570-Rhodomonas_salina.2